MAVMAGARLRVDPIACDGRGLCAELLPETVTLDDWGFPMIRDGELPSAVEEQAVEAIRLCPKLALWLDHSARRR
jgi:ferredoxin